MLLNIFKNLLRMERQSSNHVVAIVGTTGVGKSKFSIELAQKLNGEIINADSMQMYKGVPIITNKHPIEERFDVPHYVIDHVLWSEEYFVHRFEKEASEKISEILSRGKVPIIVGGTHYYLQSLLFKNKTIATGGESKEEEIVDGRLSSAEQEVLDGPADVIFRELSKHDPSVAQKFHPNDKRRIRRALEIFYLTKKKTSDFYKEQKQEQSNESGLKYNTLVYWIWSDQEVLDTRLNTRVNEMVSNGALSEIKELYDLYQSLENTPDLERGIWQVIGFKEFLPWLKDQSNDALFQEGLELMKLRTRRYARRQTKWIKNNLSPDLYKENQHNFINGGEIYLLDATDLKKWDENVSKRGLDIGKNFVNGVTKKSGYCPSGLEGLLPNFNQTKSKQETDQEEKWKHFKCNVCKTSNDEDLILVGKDQWNIHLKSRRHNSNINKGKRKREYEEWLKKKQSENSKDKLDT